MLVGSDSDRILNATLLEEDDGLGDRMLSAEEVARAFAAEADEEKRLTYARNPAAIKPHLPNYSEQTTEAIRQVKFR